MKTIGWGGMQAAMLNGKGGVAQELLDTFL
jgi:hypothetical protein